MNRVSNSLNPATIFKNYLKWTLTMITVTQTLSDTRIIVNSRYLPSSGIASDVGGMISARPRKNTVRDTRIEMQSDIYRREVLFEFHVRLVLSFH